MQDYNCYSNHPDPMYLKPFCTSSVFHGEDGETWEDSPPPHKIIFKVSYRGGRKPYQAPPKVIALFVRLALYVVR